MSAQSFEDIIEWGKEKLENNPVFKIINHIFMMIKYRMPHCKQQEEEE